MKLISSFKRDFVPILQQFTIIGSVHRTVNAESVPSNSL